MSRVSMNRPSGYDGQCNSGSGLCDEESPGGRRHMAYPSTTSFEMSKVEEIERAIQQLSSDDLSEFRAWFATFDAEVWDREFDEDVQAGRLDALAQEALDDWHGGRCTDL